MSLKRYPYLRQLQEDLTRLTVAESARAPASRAARLTISESGRDVTKVVWPGLGEYWLTIPQTKVVQELLEAIMNSRSPEVEQRHLIEVSGMKVSKLADVFGPSRAWGELVIAGRQAGCYRLYAPPATEEWDGPDDAA